jgi:hypothetical protein
MRGETIDLLTELYRTASGDTEKQRTEVAFFEATRTPSNSGYSAGLLACILKNSATVVDFFAAMAPTEPYEILQAVERKVLWLHQRNQGIGGNMGADPAVIMAREALDASIRKFRQAVDANKGFTTYKTLVGFESVFPAAWDDPSFQYEQEAAYREQRVSEVRGADRRIRRRRMVRSHTALRADGIQRPRDFPRFRSIPSKTEPSQAENRSGFHR